jgi:hypothetical protein
MVPIIIAAVVTAVLLAVSLLLISVEKNQKLKAMNQLFESFNALREKHGLTFANYECLQNTAIGLDAASRKLLIVKWEDPESSDNYLVDLDEVRCCFLKRYYSHISPGELENRKLEQFQEKVVLRFEFHNPKRTMEIPFYHHMHDYVYQLPELEQKAKVWEAMVAQITNTGVKQIA